MAFSAGYRAALQVGVRRMSTATAASNQVQFYGISGRYAHALYNAATSASALPQVTADVTAFQKLRKESVEFNEFWLNPTVPREVKTSAVEAILTTAKMSDTLKHFMMVVATSGRAADTPKILETFEAIMAAGKGEITAAVKSTVPLTDWQLALLQKKLVARFYPDAPNTQIQISCEIDDSLLGGMTIQIEDKYIDMSWKKEMGKLKDIILDGM